MPELVELRDYLISLPRRKYSELLREVEDGRNKIVEREDLFEVPPDQITREALAKFAAQLHYEMDWGIRAIYELPHGAPAEEIRFLQVNDRMRLPELEPIEPIDLTPAIDNIAFRVSVADVSPRQFEDIQAGRLALPEGWSLIEARKLAADE